MNVHPCRSSSVPSGHDTTVSWRNAPRHAVTHPPHRRSRHAVPHGCTPSSPCSWVVVLVANSCNVTKKRSESSSGFQSGYKMGHPPVALCYILQPAHRRISSCRPRLQPSTSWSSAVIAQWESCSPALRSHHSSTRAQLQQSASCIRVHRRGTSDHLRAGDRWTRSHCTKVQGTL